MSTKPGEPLKRGSITVSLSSLIKDIKLASHTFIKGEDLFPEFNGWQKGYGAFTHHINDKCRLINYIKNQEIHHQQTTWKQELRKHFEEHGVDYNEKYLF